MSRRLTALAPALAALSVLAAPVAVSHAAPQDVDLLSDDGITTRIDGQAAADQAGRQVAPAGDFNGDGRADVIVGAPDTDNNDRTDSGSAYVVYGAPGADPANVDLASTDPAVLARYMRIDGVGAGDRLGRAVAGAGDFNGDGRADVIVGAPEADPLGRTDIGAAYVVYGGTEDPANVDLASDAARFMTIAGAGSGTGGAVAGPGSLNAGARADVVVGASGADPFGRTNAGTAHVVYGETAADPADVDLISDQSRIANVYGAAPSDQLGTSVGAAGLHNGDAQADAVLGAISVDTPSARNAGAAYVLYGDVESDDPPDLDLANAGAAAPRLRMLRGATADDQLGNSVGGGVDVNGDERDDVVAGAQLADVGTRVNAGTATVLYGGTTADPPDVDLSSGDPTTTARYMSVFGGASDDRAGFAVAAAPRFGEDAFDGVIVGAIQADANGRTDSGSAFVVHGQPQADPGDVDLGSTEESTRLVRIEGAAAGDQAGRSVASAGDHNSDGSAEVIVDALRADNNGRTDSGSAYVVQYDADDDEVADSSQDGDGDGTRDRDDNCASAANDSQSDTDGDGAGDACDPDADADGIANADDDFPTNGGEQTDTDGDGTGDAADTDDDGDGTPDSDDGFPLDPSRNGRTTTTVTTTTPGPATTTPGPTVTVRVPALAPLRLWRLERRDDPSAGARSVDSGYVAACPAGGPDCVGRVTLKALRPSRGRVVKVFLHGKVPVLRIAAGTERRITFRLSARGRRTLRSLTSVTTELRGSIRTGNAEPIVRTAEVVLAP